MLSDLTSHGRVTAGSGPLMLSGVLTEEYRTVSPQEIETRFSDLRAKNQKNGSLAGGAARNWWMEKKRHCWNKSNFWNNHPFLH